MAWADCGFSIEVDQSPHVAVVRVRGEIDLLTAPEVKARCDHLAEDGLLNVVIDATGVSFIDARGVAALIESRANFEHGTFSVVPSVRVQSLIELLDAQELFPSFHSTEEALSSLYETLREAGS